MFFDDLLMMLRKFDFSRAILDFIIGQDAKDFNIGLFGPSRVGKTTLIAAMVEEFKKYSEGLLHREGSYLKLSASDQITMQKLNARINDLKGGIEYGSFKTGTLTGTEDHEVFKLRFEEGKDKLFKQNFALHDFPGGWLQQPEKIEELNIKTWDVCIVPIDAATIMESAEIKRQKKARHSLCIEEVDNFIRDWVAGRDGKAGLCILAPVKCETYFTNPRVSPVLSDKSQLLFNRVSQNYYKEIISFIRSTPYIECLYMPVNTVGCCYLKRPTWTEDGDLEGEYAISPEKGMNVWRPYGPVHIMFEICWFIAKQLEKIPVQINTMNIRTFVKAAHELKAITNDDKRYAYDRMEILQKFM